MKDINKKELITSTAKSIFGIIPIGGAALDELFFEYSSRIKQKRFENFVGILAENFTQDSKIKIENIKTEDFNDLFESVLRRVIRTKSNLKLKRFKDILIRELNSPTERKELTDLYLDLITTLSEDEISILFHHRHFDLEYEEEISKLNKLRDKKRKIDENKKRETIIIEKSKYEDADIRTKKEINVIEEWLGSLRKFKTSEFYNLDDNKFMLFKQRLFSQGLLVDNRMNRINGGTFQNMGITEFGIEFLDFIKKSE